MTLNKCQLIGNAGKVNELRYTPSGVAVMTFSVATSERFKDKDVTEWHNIVVWRQPAEFCSKFLTKGRQVYVEGRIKSRSYKDSNNMDRYITEIHADRVELLGAKPSDQNADAPPSHLNTDDDGW